MNKVARIITIVLIISLLTSNYVYAGTKMQNGAIGAAGGAMVGGAAAWYIGGIGIACCGTAVGLPAGIALITVGVVVGASVGFLGGAATGNSYETED